MQALDRVLEQLDRENLKVATVACLLVDQFKASRSPADLQEAQDFIRLGLQLARIEIRLQRTRKSRRSKHFSARAKRKPELGPKIAQHVKRLGTREFLLERRRRCLRAAADGLAWIALADMPSTIPRLFRPQTHDLPDERGLIGHVAIQQAAHDSGRFLVLENDLTRCLGLGDLTVVSLEAPELPPLSVEVKTKAPQIEEGAEMGVQLSLVEVSHPRAMEVLDDFSQLVGSEDGEQERPAVADTKQLQQFFEQAAAVVRAHANRPIKLGVVTGNWDAVQRVLGRSLVGRPSMDMAEPGVWVAAISVNHDSDQFERDITALKHLADRLIPSRDDRVMGFATTLALEEHEVTGALALPVPVWKLPPRARARILNGDFVLASFVDMSVLGEHLASRGIDLEMAEDEWVVQRNDVEFRLSQAAVIRARIDVAFGGLNLESMAERIDEMLASKRPETT